MSFLAIRKELTKRIFLFLGLPALILFGSILWLAVDWPGFLSAWIRAKFSDRRKRPKGPLSTNEPAQKISFKSLSVRKVMNKVMGRVRRSCSAEKMKSLATLILVTNDRDTVCWWQLGQVTNPMILPLKSWKCSLSPRFYRYRPTVGLQPGPSLPHKPYHFNILFLDFRNRAIWLRKEGHWPKIWS